jgi:hypothetical protein
MDLALTQITKIPRRKMTFLKMMPIKLMEVKVSQEDSLMSSTR